MHRVIILIILTQVSCSNQKSKDLCYLIPHLRNELLQIPPMPPPNDGEINSLELSTELNKNTIKLIYIVDDPSIPGYQILNLKNEQECFKNDIKSISIQDRNQLLSNNGSYQYFVVSFDSVKYLNDTLNLTVTAQVNRLIGEQRVFLFDKEHKFIRSQPTEIVF